MSGATDKPTDGAFGDETSDAAAESAEQPGRDTCDHAAAAVFDPEALNATWSDVRPGVDYVRAGRRAEQVASAMRRALQTTLKSSSVHDAVLAMVDLDGNPHLWVKLSADGALEVIELLSDELRWRGYPADDVD